MLFRSFSYLNYLSARLQRNQTTGVWATHIKDLRSPNRMIHLGSTRISLVTPGTGTTRPYQNVDISSRTLKLPGSSPGKSFQLHLVPKTQHNPSRLRVNQIQRPRGGPGYEIPHQCHEEPVGDSSHGVRNRRRLVIDDDSRPNCYIFRSPNTQYGY